MNFTFTNEKPLFPEVASPGLRSRADDNGIKPTHVLIVDDSTYNLFVLEELLKEIDNTMILIKALNGKEAVDAMTRNLDTKTKNSLFDFVLMDLHMPILDGF
jgi:CheY-like chemotaxis protein